MARILIHQKEKMKVKPQIYRDVHKYSLPFSYVLILQTLLTWSATNMNRQMDRSLVRITGQWTEVSSDSRCGNDIFPRLKLTL